MISVFRSPEPKVQVSYFDYLLSVVRRSVCPSVYKLFTCLTSSLQQLGKIQSKRGAISNMEIYREKVLTYSYQEQQCYMICDIALIV